MKGIKLVVMLWISLGMSFVILGGNITWGKRYTMTHGKHPSMVAFDDGTGRILEVHSGTQKEDIWYSIGTSDPMSQIKFNSSTRIGAGKRPSVCRVSPGLFLVMYGNEDEDVLYYKFGTLNQNKIMWADRKIFQENWDELATPSISSHHGHIVIGVTDQAYGNAARFWTAMPAMISGAWTIKPHYHDNENIPYGGEHPSVTQMNFDEDTYEDYYRNYYTVVEDTESPGWIVYSVDASKPNLPPTSVKDNESAWTVWPFILEPDKDNRYYVFACEDYGTHSIKYTEYSVGPK